MLDKFNNSRFQRNQFERPQKYEEYNITDFSFGLKSKNIKSQHFTNFAKSYDDDAYDSVLQYYIQYLEQDYSFIDDFEFDEDGIDKGYRVDRLFEIIKEIQKIKYTNKDCRYILKMKNIYNKELHLYFSYHGNNLKLILVDLYHLGIYGDRKIDGKSKPINIERLYKHHRNNDCNLADILSLTENNNVIYNS